MKAVAISAALMGLGLAMASQRTAAPQQAQHRTETFSPFTWVVPEPEYSTVFKDIRGLRNNNPGNIERTGSRWKGMAADQWRDGRFIVFESPEWGIRALGRVLVNYQRLHGLNTVEQIINRWAPTHENNTRSYINAVAQALGVRPDQQIDVQQYLLPLTKAIIHHENGIQPYSDFLLNQGLALV